MPRPGRPRAALTIAVAGLAAGACASEGAPARWAAPVDAACIAQAAAFASEVTGRRVTLGPAAFDKSHRLVLERQVARDAQGRPLDGRQQPEPAEVFELRLRRDGTCAMRHPASGREMVLTACRAEPVPHPR